jgi:hypothetical protein
MALLFGTLSLGLVFYLNFKYGYTFPLGGQYGDVREVRERDYFFIVSFSLWGLWAGIGLSAAWLELTERMREAGRRSADLLAAPVLALAFIPLLANWSWASRAGDYSARDWAYNLLMSVEPYGVLFTNGDNDTFPLWYLQEVEGIRQDVTVMVMSYLNTPWYVRQIKNLTTPCAAGQDPSSDPTRIICQRPYDAQNGPEIYRKGWIGTSAGQTPPSGVASPDELATTPSVPPPGQRPPTRGIIQLSDEQIRQVANTPPYLLPQAQQFAAGNISTILPANDLVIPADAFMASIIRAAVGDRPVYFAMTTQAFEELHLRPYLIRQGVAFKLHDGPVPADTATGIIAVPNSELSSLIGPYVDLNRSEALLTDVFVHRNGFPEEWGHWGDSATEGIPFYYGYSHYGLALVYEALGNREAAERHIRRGEAFLRLGQVRRQTD